MQRINFIGQSVFLSIALWIGLSVPSLGQDRGEPGGMGAGVGQPIPPPPPQPQPPPPPIGGGGFGQIAVGNIGIGAIPVTPPIGYAAPIRSADYNMGRFFYYPYYYFPHSYWPQESCTWPERPGQAYMRPPAYMTYPPFLEPHWRYEWYQPQRYYRGFHFWLDQF